ncbi:MAG: hypothetical protein ACRCY8_14715 [Dermatophilaceae bacterium]
MPATRRNSQTGLYLANVDADLRPKAPHIVIHYSASSEPLQAQTQRLLADVLDREP